MHEAGCRSVRVLVVDDDIAVGNVLQRSLASMPDIEAVHLDRAEAALSRAQAEDWDVVVADIRMPGMDGLELLSRLHAFDRDLPVILLTGGPSVATAQRAIELGAYRYLVKPVERKVLADVVRQAAVTRRLVELDRLADRNGSRRGPAFRAELGSIFRGALSSLWVAYQPIVRARDGSLFACEALLRTNSPALPHPVAVLDAAERLDRLHDLGRLVREIATRPLRASDDGIDLFLNLHPRDLLDAELHAPGSFLDALHGRIVLELTERSSLDGVPDAGSSVARLRERGFRIAIDDLGSGYSGLATFASLEPQIVKLDMSLVRDIDRSGTRRKVVHSMVELCHDLGRLGVAEGIETEGERETCTDLGCDLLQGFLIGRPDRAFPRAEAAGSASRKALLAGLAS